MLLRWLSLVGLALPIVGLWGSVASAHCPLCVMGAGAAALAASYLGVGKAAIGVLLGGFAVTLGLWTSRLIRRQFIPGQRQLVFGLVVVSTLLPLVPPLTRYTAFYVHLSGGYGTWLNRTYLINLFLIGSLVGGLEVWVAPALSRAVTRLRGNRMLPYQGVVITLGLLVLSALVLQLLT